ncbi:hypothetical protein [Pseudomonas congelans]|uniref:hypothetical protein n=1 Tax=Pseudomonas congelans TaxID=200452 RepID=UPI0004E30309|nr:hypothetical protein [Pseudomonas congelans]KFE46491.1 hypothetical protein IV03_11400 [Pseudomonas congelans]
MTEEVWEHTPEERRNLLVHTIWEGILALVMKAEEELGPEELKPLQWSTFSDTSNGDRQAGCRSY